MEAKGLYDSSSLHGCYSSLLTTFHTSYCMMFLKNRYSKYLQMDMNPVCLGDDAPFVYKDAIIFSGHKFIGGPGNYHI